MELPDGSKSDGIVLCSQLFIIPSFDKLPNTTVWNVAPNNDRHSLLYLLLDSMYTSLYTFWQCLVAMSASCAIMHTSYLKIASSTEMVSDEALLNSTWINWGARWISYMLLICCSLPLLLWIISCLLGISRTAKHCLTIQFQTSCFLHLSDS